MTFLVLFDDAFAEEFRALDLVVQKAILTAVKALQIEGHQLGRPWVDTLKGSAHPDMKELRARARRADWRVAFAFDPARQAVMLAAAAKGGGNEARIYKRLVALADRRFSAHTAGLSKTT